MFLFFNVFQYLRGDELKDRASIISTAHNHQREVSSSHTDLTGTLSKNLIEVLIISFTAHDFQNTPFNMRIILQTKSFYKIFSNIRRNITVSYIKYYSPIYSTQPTKFPFLRILSLVVYFFRTVPIGVKSYSMPRPA